MNTNRHDKPAPWLIAGWPGMGNVAIIAAGYLIHQLGMKQVAELPSGGHFDIDNIAVKDGVVQAARWPRGFFYRWSNPAGRDLVVFLGEAQPSTGTYAYAQTLVEAAQRLGVERVVTFASLASNMAPGAGSRVTGVATSPQIAGELERAGVQPLADGQIGGLNGVVLAAATERGLSGLGLLGEVPIYAAAVPSPQAARAALSVFSVLAGIDLNLEELTRHAEAMSHALVEAIEKARRAAEGAQESDEPEPEDFAGPVPPEERTPEPGLDQATRQRIEHLFAEARSDPSRARALKTELDALGLFDRYEDRFLDLFRKRAA